MNEKKNKPEPQTHESGRVSSSVQAVSKQRACYAIMSDAGMYMGEICVCEDRGPLEDIIKEFNEDEPDENYRVVELFAC